MRYFKVKRNTEQWDRFNLLWTFEDKWIENKDRLEKIIGCSMDKNLVLITENLYLTNVPVHLLNQFSKNTDKNGFYKAKVKSQVNIEFSKLVNELGLRSYSFTRLVWELCLPSQQMKIKTLYQPLFDEYYFEADESYYGVTNHEKWYAQNWFEEIDEVSFLRLYADWKENESKTA